MSPTLLHGSIYRTQLKNEIPTPGASREATTCWGLPELGCREAFVPLGWLVIKKATAKAQSLQSCSARCSGTLLHSAVPSSGVDTRALRSGGSTLGLVAAAAAHAGMRSALVFVPPGTSHRASNSFLESFAGGKRCLRQLGGGSTTQSFQQFAELVSPKLFHWTFVI